MKATDTLLSTSSTFFLHCSLWDASVCCSDPSSTLGGGVDLRSALHLHRVASFWEVLLTEPGAVRTQVQPPTGEVPLLEKGHLRAEIPRI